MVPCLEGGGGGGGVTGGDDALLGLSRCGSFSR